MSRINLLYFIKGCLEHPRFEEGKDHYGEGELGWIDYLADRADELLEVLELFCQIPASGVEAYELVEELAVNAFFEWYFSDRSVNLKYQFCKVASDWYEFDAIGYMQETEKFDGVSALPTWAKVPSKNEILTILEIE